MISDVGNSPRMMHQDVAGPGKKMNSVGHQAKAAVQAAQEAGADMPKNAQGLAASAIAKGADPASVFAGMIVPDDPVDVPTEDGTLDQAVVDSKSPPVQDLPPMPEEGDMVVTDGPMPDGGTSVPETVSGAAIALDLLEAAEQQS